MHSLFQVLKQLVSQVARYNWVTMALNMEWDSIKDILQLLLKFNSIMVERSNDSKERLVGVYDVLSPLLK